MGLLAKLLEHPSRVGAACAVGAVGLGLGYMAAAGAPSHYLGVNAAALVIGLGMSALIGDSLGRPAVLSGLAPAFGGVLLATALFGASVEGASRWVKLGPVFLQPSLVLLPFMLVAFARRRDPFTAAGLLLAAAALALQPDRAMAGVLALGVGLLAARTRDRWALAVLPAAVVSFGLTLLREDALPAVPYVDRVLYTAFDAGLAAGAAVLLGTLLLIVPALLGAFGDASRREVHLTFGAAWLGVVAAAALGDYPTPLVGYGGAAVLGYALSLSVLPGGAARIAGSRTGSAGVEGAKNPRVGDRRLGVA